MTTTSNRMRIIINIVMHHPDLVSGLKKNAETHQTHTDEGLETDLLSRV